VLSEAERSVLPSGATGKRGKPPRSSPRRSLRRTGSHTEETVPVRRLHRSACRHRITLTVICLLHTESSPWHGPGWVQLCKKFLPVMEPRSSSLSPKKCTSETYPAPAESTPYLYNLVLWTHCNSVPFIPFYVFQKFL
jgi:hypothetical protein